MLAFVGTAAFCLFSLASPDSDLLPSNEKLNVPFAGPVSFYRSIWNTGDRLNRIAERTPLLRAPTLAPLKNPFIRAFSGLTFYFLLPVTMLVFSWKAAVVAAWDRPAR